MCCDYAAYADGSFSCILYTGSDTTDQDMGDFPDDLFSHFTFQHLQYASDEDDKENGAAGGGSGGSSGGGGSGGGGAPQPQVIPDTCYLYNNIYWEGVLPSMPAWNECGIPCADGSDSYFCYSCKECPGVIQPESAL
jgi:hypothetical protein